MRNPRRSAKTHFGTGGFPVFLLLLLLLPAIVPAPCHSADITLSSRTYLLYYEREFPGAEDRQFAPLYEYLSGDASGLGDMPLSFHFYGWGRLDLGDDTDDDGRGGDLASAYVQYLHPTGNAEMRLGRFFFTEGTAAEILDGVFLKARAPSGFGVSLFGGVPVERSITATDTGDSLYGGRLFFVQAGYAELGVTYLVEEGDFRGDDRETVGGDLWLRPGGIPVELTGRAAYNVSTSALASQRYALRLRTFPRMDLSVGYEGYEYKDLFQAALHSAFHAPAVDDDDEVQSFFALVDFQVIPALTLTGGAKNIRHDKNDPGDATRFEAGLRYAYNDRNDLAGLSAAVVTADRSENEYQEYRAFAIHTLGDWRLTLDALTQQYEEEISGSGIQDAYQVVATAGYKVLPNLKLSGDLRYTRSPRFSEDYAGLVKASLDLGMTTGGN